MRLSLCTQVDSRAHYLSRCLSTLSQCLQSCGDIPQKGRGDETGRALQHLTTTLMHSALTLKSGYSQTEKCSRIMFRPQAAIATVAKAISERAMLCAKIHKGQTDGGRNLQLSMDSREDKLK